MAQPKGHRANKSNDSFGTINNANLYRGKYREEVYQDDDEVTTSEDPSEVEATPEDPSFAKPQEGSDTDYKKRYDDLKHHYDTKLDEWKREREELAQAQQAGRESGLKASELPKTPEQLEAFKAKYPDVYAIVETVSSLQAENRLKALKEEVESLKGKEKELHVQSAYRELLNAHPEFNSLKADERFLAWLDEQPQSISDGIYKNNTDAKWAIRVVDLYKADTGLKTRKKSKDADPATMVTRTSSKDIVGEATPDKRVWKASEIRKMKSWEFEKFETELDAARAEGRIDYQR